MNLDNFIKQQEEILDAAVDAAIARVKYEESKLKSLKVIKMNAPLYTEKEILEKVEYVLSK